MVAVAGMVADGVAAGAVVGTADAGGDVLIETGVRGVLVAVEGIRAGPACPEWATGDWCAEALRAMPPVADAARNPTITAARASRRRVPGPLLVRLGLAAGWRANTGSCAAVTVIDASAAGTVHDRREPWFGLDHRRPGQDLPGGGPLAGVFGQAAVDQPAYLGLHVSRLAGPKSAR